MSAAGHWASLAILLWVSFWARGENTDKVAAEKPLFSEFMGINGHTIQFKPLLYASACRSVRDYHPMEWDTGADTFDDKDEPQIHGSSGLTRQGRPKPAFHAVAHLKKTLGDYRFRRVVEEKPSRNFVYEYVHGDDPRRRIWAVWSPTGTGKHERH